MRFLLDMGISIRVTTWFREIGHDAVHLSDEKLHMLADNDIIQKAIIETRIILTADMDFGHLLATHPKLKFQLYSLGLQILDLITLLINSN